MFERTRYGIRSQLVSFDSIVNDNDSDDEDLEGGEESRLVTRQSTICIYQMFLAQEQALYQNMNMMRAANQRFIGYFWAPVENEKEITQSICSDGTAEIEPYDDHTIEKPTYFKPNEFSYVF